MEKQKDIKLILNENADLKVKIIFMSNQISKLNKKIKELINPYNFH